MENNPLKKILIITYYWPPAGGPGVQRWLKFVKYLPELGYEPHVYVPENATYPITDSNLEKEVSNQAIIIKKPITEPYQWASFFSKKKTKTMSSGIIKVAKKQSVIERILLWIRGNVFIPDARVFWVKPSVLFLKKYIQENNIDVIITSGPPHSLHLVGLQLKKEMPITWITDFRDPWTTIGYHKQLKLSNWAKNIHKKLEKEVLTTCDTVIVTSQTTKTEFLKITNQPIEVITNGYDVEQVEKPVLDTQFSLAHIGSLLSERNPIILWEVLQELIQEKPDFAAHFELKLMGAVSTTVLETLKEFGLEKYTVNKGYVSHEKALRAQRASQVLLIIEIDSEETNCIIPGKLFEYMVSGRPIIGIGPAKSDFKSILLETNTGTFFTYQDKEKLKVQISMYFELFLENKLQVFPVGVEQYSRKKRTEKLVALLP